MRASWWSLGGPTRGPHPTGNHQIEGLKNVYHTFYIYYIYIYHTFHITYIYISYTLYVHIYKLDIPYIHYIQLILDRTVSSLFRNCKHINNLRLQWMSMAFPHRLSISPPAANRRTVPSCFAKRKVSAAAVATYKNMLPSKGPNISTKILTALVGISPRKILRRLIELLSMIVLHLRTSDLEVLVEGCL